MKLRKKYLTTLLLINLTMFLLLPALVLATDSMSDILDRAGGSAGYDTGGDKKTFLATVAGAIIQIFISIVGVIFVSYTIYGGFLWMTAAGNEEKVTKAKSIISQGIIGIIVIFGATAIYLLIRNILVGSGSVPYGS